MLLCKQAGKTTKKEEQEFDPTADSQPVEAALLPTGVPNEEGQEEGGEEETEFMEDYCVEPVQGHNEAENQNALLLQSESTETLEASAAADPAETTEVKVPTTEVATETTAVQPTGKGDAKVLDPEAAEPTKVDQPMDQGKNTPSAQAAATAETQVEQPGETTAPESKAAAETTKVGPPLATYDGLPQPISPSPFLGDLDSDEEVNRRKKKKQDTGANKAGFVLTSTNSISPILSFLSFCKDRQPLTSLPPPPDGSLKSQAEKAAEQLMRGVSSNNVDLLEVLLVVPFKVVQRNLYVQFKFFFFDVHVVLSSAFFCVRPRQKSGKPWKMMKKKKTQTRNTRTNMTQRVEMAPRKRPKDVEKGEDEGEVVEEEEEVGQNQRKKMLMKAKNDRTMTKMWKKKMSNQRRKRKNKVKRNQKLMLTSRLRLRAQSWTRPVSHRQLFLCLPRWIVTHAKRMSTHSFSHILVAYRKNTGWPQAPAV